MTRAKFEVVSIEEDKPARTSNRKVVIVVVIVLLLVLAVIVAVGLYVALGSGGGGDDSYSKAQIAVLDGGWAEWKPWSECSAACGAGIQTRVRACTDPAPVNGGRKCGGAAGETRTCADWSCPDCERQCPSNGRLNSNCTLCLCDGNVVLGGVASSGRSNTPVAGVKIYEVSQEWAPLATTNTYGVFSIDDLCFEGTLLKLRKEGYISQRETYQPSGQPLHVEMIPLVKPAFRDHPIDTAALVGEEVTLNCSASGVPEPTHYEWFKNGYIVDIDCLDDQCMQMQLKDVREEHSGSYKCRAVSKAGKRFSDPADVVIKDSGNSFCKKEPTSHFSILPATCQAMVDILDVNKLDIGSCTSSPCTMANAANEEQLCCGPVTYQDIKVNCEGFSYSLKKVSSCGCTICAEDKTKEVIVDVQCRLIMRTPDGAYIETPVPRLFYVEYAYTHVTYGQTTGYTQTGKFQLQAASANGKIVVQFLSGLYLDYLPQVSVIDVPKGVHKISHVVTLMPKDSAKSVEVDPKLETAVQYGDATQTPAGSLIIPPNAITGIDGGLVTQSMFFSLTFTDPREPSSLNIAPGTFTFEDEEGETRQLQTFGVLGFAGETNLINGEVEMQVDLKALGIGNSQDDEPDAWLWAFDGQSGDWKRTSRLSYDEDSLRKKRQADSSTASARTEIPYPLPYLNIDRPIFRYGECKVAVIVYEDNAFSVPLEGDTVVAYTKDSESGSYLGMVRGTTDKQGKTCLSIPCGYSHELKLASAFGPGRASPSHVLPTGFEFQNLALAGTSDNGNGVIYDTVRFSSPVADDDFTNEGPVYRFRSYGSTCPAELSIKYNFQFLAPQPEASGSLNAVELRPHRKLSWYQLHATEVRRACMVKVKILSMDASQTKVVGISKFGDKAGDAFGTYTAGTIPGYDGERRQITPNNLTSCVQVKCPEEIRDTDEMEEYGMTSTYVELNIAHPNVSRCKLKWARKLYEQEGTPAFTMQEVTNSSLSIQIHGFEVFHFGSRYISTGEGFGDGGYQRALRSCLTSGPIDLALFDCADGQIETGWWDSPREERPQK